MAVYLLITYDITDPKAYEPYVPGVIPLIRKHGGEVLAADFEPASYEGDSRGVAVVLKFPSAEAADNWYNDPDYRPIRQIRFDSCTNSSIYRAAELDQ